MDRASQRGVSTSFIELNALSDSVVETIKGLAQVLSCLGLSGTIDPQLSLFSPKSVNATSFFLDFKFLHDSTTCVWHTEYVPMTVSTGKSYFDSLGIPKILFKM